MFTTNVVEIKKLMVECGFDTVCQLSKESGVNRNTLALILNGSVQPSSTTMYKLAQTLNMNPETAGRIFFAKKLTERVSDTYDNKEQVKDKQKGE